MMIRLCPDARGRCKLRGHVEARARAAAARAAAARAAAARAAALKAAGAVISPPD